MLDHQAFVVLRSAGEDSAGGIAMSSEGRVSPLVGFNGDAVNVRVEEDGGQIGPRTWPGE